MGIEVGDIQTGAPTYRNFKESLFKLLDVASYINFIASKVTENLNH